MAEVHDVQVILRGKDTFGQVLDGYLRISGPYQKFSSCRASQGLLHCYLKEIMPSLFPDSADTSS